MATSETTSPVDNTTLRFTATTGIYSVLPSATALDLGDQLSARLSHLSAMLGMVYGGGYENFSEMNETAQENYLWACAATARECEQLQDLISGRDPLPEGALVFNEKAEPFVVLAAAVARADCLHRSLVAWSAVEADASVSAAEVAQTLEPLAQEVRLLLGRLATRI